ncbi:unnamed protein product, partial [Mesorhabditis spiculigera]
MGRVDWREDPCQAEKAALEDYYELLSQNFPEPQMAPRSQQAAVITHEPHPSDPHPLEGKILEKDLKKKKFVPWEPFKAAPSADRKGEQPVDMPSQLIRYRTGEKEEPLPEMPSRVFVDQRKERLQKDGRQIENEEINRLAKELQAAETQLNVEREQNAELKRLLMATIDDDLQCHVSALSEDKVRLANRIDQYANKMKNEDDELDALTIEKEVWKCKFLAMSIRADELKARNEALLKVLRCAQHTISESGPSVRAHLTDELKQRFDSLTAIDLTRLIERSPAEERYTGPTVNFHNLTISCCKNCSGREIKLL